MERGPMALFGAIVAVGLGPALWLGAQFGNLGGTPYSPPAVVSEQNADKVPGGAGAAAPEDDEPITEPTKITKYIPLSGTPSARPSRSATAPAAKPVDDKTTEPTESAKATESTEPTTPATESTTEPTTSAEPGTDDEEQPTSQPS